MKCSRIYFLILLSALTFEVIGQGWCAKSNFPGSGLRSSSGFSIGGSGFHCFGTNGFSNSNQLWEYSASTDSWSRKTNVPGPGRRSGVAFKIGLEAFAGLGWEGSRAFKDMYKYNQPTNSWSQLDSFPGLAIFGSMATAYNGKGYLIGGSSNGITAINQLYEYDPVVDSWTLLSNNLPIGARLEGVMEVVGNEIFVGFGHDFINAYDDFWKYTPFGNTWTQVASLPSTARLNPVSFTVNGKLVVGGGYNLGSATQHSDYFEYDPITDVWNPVFGFNSGARSRSSSFVVNDSAYLIGGWVGTTSGSNNNEVWQYTLVDGSRTDTTACEGEVLILDVRANVSATYQWQDNNRNSRYRVTQPGIYWVNVSPINECTRRDSFVVSYVPAPQVELGVDTSFCSKQTYVVSAFNAGTTYLWQDSSTSASYSINQSGVYSVAVSNGSCIISDTVEVIYYDPPVVNLGLDRSLCFGEVTVLDAFNEDATYLWQDGSTNSTYKVTGPGVYSVAVFRNGCETNKSVNISYIERPDIYLGEDTILCEGASISLAVNEAGATFKWQDGAVGNRYIVNRKGLYWVEASLNGCKSKDSIFVDYTLFPKIEFGNDKTVCFGDGVFLDAYEPNTTSYLWQDGYGGSRYIISESGFYSVLATNECGVGGDSINIIMEDCDCNFYLPNAFSPNGDGVNDEFGPVYQCELELSNYQMLIFNRWGELLYETTDILSPWDGLINNETLPNGSYVYSIQYQQLGSGRFEQLKGTIIIIN